MDNISIIIPVYNESENVSDVIEDIMEFIRDNSQLKVEVICVNDGSTDNSKEVLERYDFIRIINHDENRGYGAALKTGIGEATFDTIVLMDSDGQHNPYDILSLLAEYASDNTMVVGKRKITDTDKNRVMGKFIIQSLAKYLFSNEIEDINSGFRIFSKKQATKFFHLCSDRFSFSTSITLAYLAYNLNVKYVPIEVRERAGGRSTVSIKSAIQMIMKIIQIAMVYNPLKVIMPIFFVSSFCGAYSLIVDLYNENLSDSTILFICVSVIFLVFAFISEQIKTVRLEIIEKLRALDEEKK